MLKFPSPHNNDMSINWSTVADYRIDRFHNDDYECSDINCELPHHWEVRGRANNGLGRTEWHSTWPTHTKAQNMLHTLRDYGRDIRDARKADARTAQLRAAANAVKNLNRVTGYEVERTHITPDGDVERCDYVGTYHESLRHSYSVYARHANGQVTWLTDYSDDIDHRHSHGQALALASTLNQLNNTGGI